MMVRVKLKRVAVLLSQFFAVFFEGMRGLLGGSWDLVTAYNWAYNITLLIILRTGLTYVTQFLVITF